jgi:hypothetical protein
VPAFKWLRGFGLLPTFCELKAGINYRDENQTAVQVKAQRQTRPQGILESRWAAGSMHLHPR